MPAMWCRNSSSCILNSPAVRLTSGTGIETDPAFSPDGTRIAFTGEYDGNIDVFVVPASGGVPKRLTWHPAADRVLGWTPDGKRIIFGSTRTAYSRYGEMFTVPAEGGVEEKLPLPTGYQASMSADGQSIAYEPIGKAFVMWKRYRGGQTARIWLANLADSSITKVPRTNSNDFNPMWSGDRVYFLSDRNGAVTLFYYEKERRDLVTVSACDLLESFFDIQKELRAALTTAYLAELVEEFVPARAREDVIFRLLLAVLQALAGRGDLDFLTRYFEAWLLHSHGVLPDVKRCKKCRKDIEADGWLAPRRDGVYCGDCAPARKEEVRRELAQFLGWVRKNPPPRESVPGFGPAELKGIGTALQAMIVYHLEREPRSLRFLKA